MSRLFLNMEAASAWAEKSSKHSTIVDVQLYKNRKKLSSSQQKAAVITDFRNTYFIEGQRRDSPPSPPTQSLCSFHQFHHRLHLIGPTAQHCGPSEGRLAVARHHGLARGEQTHAS